MYDPFMPYFVKSFIYVKEDTSNFVVVAKARIYLMCNSSELINTGITMLKTNLIL